MSSSIPRAPQGSAEKSRAGWCPGEDACLERGMLHFGLDAATIRQHLLPAKSPAEIKARIRLLGRPEFGKNPVWVRSPIRFVPLQAVCLLAAWPQG